MARREARKPREPLPEIPSGRRPFGPRIRKPKKTNRAAAKLIAAGVFRWDNRHSDRKKRKRAIELQAGIDRKSLLRLTKPTRKAMLASMPSWGWSNEHEAFIAADGGVPTETALEELRTAMEGLGESSVDVYVVGLPISVTRQINKALPFDGPLLFARA